MNFAFCDRDSQVSNSPIRNTLMKTIGEFQRVLHLINLIQKIMMILTHGTKTRPRISESSETPASFVTFGSILSMARKSSESSLVPTNLMRTIFKLDCTLFIKFLQSLVVGIKIRIDYFYSTRSL